MRRALAVCLLVGAACSRGGGPADEGPLAPATAAGIPSAATSARIMTPETTPDSANLPALGIVGGSSGGGHVPPHVHDDGATLSSAALTSEVIRRIVRQNFGRFRLCYENGLRSDPTLAGSVRTRFVIEPDGAVGTVSDAGSVMSDAGVVACVQRAFGSLAFPTPAGGVSLSVTYSLSFTAS
ncbi:MAG TPA: AgmX/PglI C-terminal domain-containing protein [Polyangiaceae bacterium]|nr:AgmX/PglI C-terminal domain-containing protein [Polyangiaceae bacterium]